MKFPTQNVFIRKPQNDSINKPQKFSVLGLEKFLGFTNENVLGFTNENFWGWKFHGVSSFWGLLPSTLIFGENVNDKDKIILEKLRVRCFLRR